jgi:hypothetical protein
MRWVGLTLAPPPGPTWLAGLEFCARADSANRQEKAPVNKTSPHVGLVKNVLITRLGNVKIPGREKERATGRKPGRRLCPL